jgi:hypothetical protein
MSDAICAVLLQLWESDTNVLTAPTSIFVKVRSCLYLTYSRLAETRSNFCFFHFVACEAKDNHEKSHVFLKIRRPLIAEVNNKVPLFSDLKTHEAPNQGVKQPPIQEMRFD